MYKSTALLCGMLFDSRGVYPNFAAVSKVSDEIASWELESEMGTKAVLLHPFKSLICIADDKETIRYQLG